ncbi:MAG TPA: TetR/AcrR family transcriptional regulator [Ktedonobacterales bacterium]|nr:TetR/AcrR family transcriptional regulator [Ktedonobacterales bacterium]
MPRPDVSGERRSQILDAAMAVFSRRGFHAARMDDIAEEAGLSKGALYLYYKSKDAIIGAILRFFFSSAMKSLRTLQDSDGVVRDQIVSYARVVAREAERLSRVSPLAYEFYAVAGRNRAVRLQLREYFTQFKDVLAILIQRGIEQGEFRSVNPQETAYTICALFEGLNLLLVVDPQTENWHHQVVASTELVLDGIAAR